MSSLYIIQGPNELHIEPSDRKNYVYRFGIPEVTGEQFVDINCSKKLDRKAEQIRDSYVKWIAGINSLFLSRNLVHKSVSLFYFTDLSCKRTEIFDTFSIVVNILVIKDAVWDQDLEEIHLIGVSSQFSDAIRFVFPKTRIIEDYRRQSRKPWVRTILSDVRYYAEMFTVGLLNYFISSRKKVPDQIIGRCFFSIFPTMLQSDRLDKKYGTLVDVNDTYALSVITDGYHQHYGVWKYFSIRKNIVKNKFYVIDDYIRMSDGMLGVWQAFKLWTNARSLMRSKKYFEGVDLTSSIAQEVIISLSRAGRLSAYSNCLARFLNKVHISEFVYYLHEYPLGRMISWVIATQQRKIKSVGMQHGPASWRKLLYFLTVDESAANTNWWRNVPIPDEIWAEDNESAEIYHHAGYNNVLVLPRIYRLAYLEGISIECRQEYALVAPGLHDGESMLFCMKPIFEKYPNVKFLIRSHPLSCAKYLKQFDHISNLSVSKEIISDLLSRVGAVYVTYSSVGIEARSLGLPVFVVSIPGVINQSPLIDNDH
jgi:hypothetical protein